jgi:hypothetical protein
MKTKWMFSALMLVAMLSMGAPAFAHGRGGGGGNPGGPSGAAPEVDPSLAVAGVSFLTGTLVVLRSRRRK